MVKVPRVLVAKPGLDCRDRGAKVAAHTLKGAGGEVIHTGLHQTFAMIVEAAIQEDADGIGLSKMSSGHIPTIGKLFDLLNEKGVNNITVLVGGVIPSRDIKHSRKWECQRFIQAASAATRLPPY